MKLYDPVKEGFIDICCYSITSKFMSFKINTSFEFWGCL